MSEFDHIIMYLSVVETKSFTAAAEKIGISANAVSKQVSLLEEELGLTLLSRSTRHLTVTEAGKIIYEKGKLVRKGLADINEFALSSQAEPSGVFTILSTVGVGQYLMADHLADFLHLYPKLELNLIFSDDFPSPEEFDSMRIDIAFGFAWNFIPEKNIQGDFICKPLINIKRLVCASPQYLDRYGEPQTYADLQHHYLLVHSKNLKIPLINECQARAIPLTRMLKVNNTSSIIRLMRSGVGIASVADFIVENEIASGHLKKILPIHHEEKVQTHLFYRKSRHTPLKISRFIEFITQRI